MAKRTLFSRWPHLVVAAGLAFLSVGTLESCVTPGIMGSGVPRTETRDLNSFSSVAVYNGFEFVYIENNNRAIPVVRLTIDDNLSPFVDMTVNNGQLIVRLNQRVSSATRRLEVEGPPLTGLRLFGRSTGNVSRWVSRFPVVLEVDANSNLEIGAIEADSAQIKVTGQSTLNITGGAISSVQLNVNNRSTVRAEAMRTQRVDATLTDRSLARVNVLTLLTATLGSTSELSYSGSPQIQPTLLDRDSRLTPLDVGG